MSGKKTKPHSTYREALQGSISTEDFAKVVKALVKEAKRGKAWAVKLTFSLALSKLENRDLDYAYRSSRVLDLRDRNPFTGRFLEDS